VVEGFELPSEERFKKLCKNLKLYEDQRGELAAVIYRAHADLKEIFRAKMSDDERKRLMLQLRKFQVSLDQLLKMLGVKAKEIAKFNDDLHFAHGTPEGMAAASKMIRAVAGRRARKAYQSGAPSTMPFETMDLCHQLMMVKNGTDTLLNAKALDLGGRNADVTRNYLALALGRSSQNIIGRRATSTAGGRFVNLVRAVLLTCGLSDSGVEKLVERTVNSLKAQR
jgi:hypothetical protein